MAKDVRKGNKRVTFSLNIELHRKLKIMAAKKDKHMSEIVTDAILSMLKKEEIKQKNK